MEYGDNSKPAGQRHMKKGKMGGMSHTNHRGTMGSGNGSVPHKRTMGTGKMGGGAKGAMGHHQRTGNGEASSSGNAHPYPPGAHKPSADGGMRTNKSGLKSRHT